jgi:hypothetical protein
MKLTLELSTSQLIQSAGYNSPITSLAQSYGEGSRIEVEVLREGALVTPTELEEFVLIVKPRGQFAADPLLAGCETFTWDSDIERWVGEIDYNVAALTAQLHTIGDSTDQQESLTLWAQFAWRKTSGDNWQRTQLIKDFRLDNALWKGNETFPTTGTPIEGSSGPWLTPLVRSIAADVINDNASANTIATITDLDFPVESGERYHFRFVIPFTAAATTTGKRFSITGPASPTFLAYESRYHLTGTTQTVNFGLTAYDLPAAADASSLTTGNLAVIEGVIIPSANGTVSARFASEVSNSAITAKAGATVQYTKLS